MILNEVFPSKYVKAADIKGRGDVTVAIADVRMEKLGDDQKLVVYFQNKEKGLVCNKTNANRIAYLYGEETDDWIGKEIALSVEFVEFQGRTVEAIRVKPPAVRAAAKPPLKNVVIDRGTHQISTMQPADEIEKMIGPAPTPTDAPF